MKKTVLITTVALLTVFAVSSAFAGSGGTEFESIFALLSDWAKGYLGKSIALAFFLVGITMGIVRQSLMSAVVGIGAAMVVNYGPTIIDNMLSCCM